LKTSSKGSTSEKKANIHPLGVFLDGTQTNQREMIKFRRGAFVELKSDGVYRTWFKATTEAMNMLFLILAIP
jgi:hypothetical protein